VALGFRLRRGVAVGHGGTAELPRLTPAISDR